MQRGPMNIWRVFSQTPWKQYLLFLVFDHSRNAMKSAFLFTFTTQTWWSPNDTATNNNHTKARMPCKSLVAKNMDTLCTDLLTGILMNTFSQHCPIIGLKKEHYKRKALHTDGWEVKSLPKPTKLDFNIHNFNRGGPYDLILMSKSVHNGIQQYGRAGSDCLFISGYYMVMKKPNVLFINLVYGYDSRLRHNDYLPHPSAR